MSPITFLIEDEGDGWWHCPSPLRATVIDGPAPKFGPPKDARWPETFWLVSVDPPIEWHGDASYATRWGPDHPLTQPFTPTTLALVMASSRYSGPIDPNLGLGVPIYPVGNSAKTVAEAEPIAGVAIKAALRPVRA